MTQEETTDLLAWIEQGQHRATTKALRKFSRTAIVGFMVLLAALLFVRHEDASRADRALKARVAVANSQRQAIVNSGTVVAVEGCNDRFKDRVEVRSILVSSREFSKREYKAGTITRERYLTALQFYRERLAGLPLPDCRKAKNALTTDISEVPPVPTPLYPGSAGTKGANRSNGGQDPGARPNSKRGE